MSFQLISMIEINNLTTNRVDEEFLKKIAKNVLREEKQEKKDLSIALVRQRRIRELNKKYRKKNRATDVLSFQYQSEAKSKRQASSLPSFSLRESSVGGKEIYPFDHDDLGEIVISPQQVRKNAKRFTPLEIRGTRKKYKESKSLTGFDSTFKKELARVLIHGILHLLGYDHERNGKGAREMKEKENYYFSQVNSG